MFLIFYYDMIHFVVYKKYDLWRKFIASDINNVISLIANKSVNSLAKRLLKNSN